MSGAGADEIVGGDGIDLVSYEDLPDAVTVNLGTGVLIGGAMPWRRASSIEGVIGTRSMTA